LKTILIRSLSGAIYVILILGDLLLHKSAFALVIMLFNLQALREYYTMQKVGRIRIPALIIGTLIFTLAHLVWSMKLDTQWLSVIGLSPMVLMLFSLFTKSDNQKSDISTTIFGFAYITLPLLMVNAINLSEESRFSYVLMAMLLIIWTNDIFAYLTGMAFGRHKIFERVSPKKTWEGFFGGIVAALGMGYLTFSYIDGLSLWSWLAISILIALSGVAGDFVESLFKRSAGVKDSGNLIPGHGGILDRIDSLLFAAPVLYLCLILLKYIS